MCSSACHEGICGRGRIAPSILKWVHCGHWHKDGGLLPLVWFGLAAEGMWGQWPLPSPLLPQRNKPVQTGAACHREHAVFSLWPHMSWTVSLDLTLEWEMVLCHSTGWSHPLAVPSSQVHLHKYNNSSISNIPCQLLSAVSFDNFNLYKLGFLNTLIPEQIVIKNVHCLIF